MAFRSVLLSVVVVLVSAVAAVASPAMSVGLTTAGENARWAVCFAAAQGRTVRAPHSAALPVADLPGIWRPGAGERVVLTEVPDDPVNPAKLFHSRSTYYVHRISAPPGTFVLVLVGFIFFVLAEERRRWASAVRVVFAAGQAGLDALPRVVAHLGSGFRPALAAVGLACPENGDVCFESFTPEIDFIGLLRRILARAAGKSDCDARPALCCGRTCVFAVVNSTGLKLAAASFLASKGLAASGRDAVKEVLR